MDRFFGGYIDRVQKHFFEADAVIAAEHPHGIAHIVRVDGVSLLEQTVELIEQVAGKCGGDVVALDEYVASPRLEYQVRFASDSFQVAVMLPEKLPCQVIVGKRQAGMRAM